MDFSKNNSFEQIKIEDSRKILQSTILSKDKLKIWTNNQSQTLETKITSTLDAGINFYFTLSPNNQEKEFIKNINAAGVTECFCTINLPSDVIFFKIEFKKEDTFGFHFKVNEPIFKAQRRTAFRLPISESLKLHANFTVATILNTQFKVKVFDISAGGLGLIVTDATTASLLNPGTIVSQLTFRIRDRDFNLSGEIRYNREFSITKTTKGYRLGLKFIGLTPNEDAFLTGYVFEESIKLTAKS